MANDNNSKPGLMTETTFYILLSLVEPLHGYVVMKKVEEISEGTVTIGPGTLYGAFSKLEKDKLIEVVSEGDRRKSYGLTSKGKQVLLDQINKFSIMAENGQKVVKLLAG
jgi:DNA-binding PadR family transcriptional regulator